MSHDYHEQLPGYSQSQILHDGCGECEYRSGLDDHGLSQLDPFNFQHAWARATAWNKTGRVTDISDAERPLLTALWAMQIQLERLGWPIGFLPTPSLAGGLT